MIELLVTVMGDRIHTMETARTTEMGLTSSRVSILVTVGMRAVVSSSTTAVDGSDVSVANVDIVALAAITESRAYPRLHDLPSGQVPFVLVDASSSVRRHDVRCLPDCHVAPGRHGRSTARSLALKTRTISRADVVAPRCKQTGAIFHAMDR